MELSTQILQKNLIEVKNAISKKASRLKVKSPCNNVTKNTKQYKKELPKEITVLVEYINNYTPILHRHICGYEWLIKPNNILNGQGCHVCQDNNFNSFMKACTYLIYFKELNVYKIGITNNISRRLNEFGYIAEVILVINFDTGKEAQILEKNWLSNIEYLKFNTNKLISGNTETFKW